MFIPEPVIKRLDHLGLIAAFCHEAGLPRMIDAIIPKYAEHTVSRDEPQRAGISQPDTPYVFRVFQA